MLTKIYIRCGSNFCDAFCIVEVIYNNLVTRQWRCALLIFNMSSGLTWAGSMHVLPNSKQNKTELYSVLWSLLILMFNVLWLKTEWSVYMQLESLTHFMWNSKLIIRDCTWYQWFGVHIHKTADASLVRIR